MNWKETTSGNIQITSGEILPKIEVFVAKLLQLESHLDHYRSLLSTAELERVSHFVFDNDRNLYILSHGYIREILAAKTGVLPLEIRYAYSSLGKPYLEKGSPQFNLSHTRDIFAIAISEDLPVGIDIENYSRVIDWKPVARLFYSETEQQWIESHPERDKKQAFFTIWTRKEALLKAMGLGIVNNLSAISVIEPTFHAHPELFPNLPLSFPLWELRTFHSGNFTTSIALPTHFEADFQSNHSFFEG